MRHSLIHLITAVFAALLFTACDDKKSTNATEVAEEAAEHGHAGAKPGSHEDWCGEHAVPESLCTRCNAALIPAFKATNDWCGEHGLPESQCIVCNPGLKIERPPKSKETGK